MKFLPLGSSADLRVSAQIEPSQSGTESRKSRPGAAVHPLTPLDPVRQAKRVPIRLLKMLTAHGGHLLHPEYLQPLTSAPVSIELDAKKSPLALLAQTCSQIGKSDPPPSSKLGSSSSCSGGGGGQTDKEAGGGGGGGRAPVKLGEHRPPLEDKSSFKPYNKGGGGDGRREGEKVGFRVPANGGPSAGQQPYSPRADGGTPPGHAQQQRHKQNQSPGGPLTSADEAAHEQGSPKKDVEVVKARPDSPHQANSSLARASTNCSNGSSDGGSSNHDGGKAESAPPSLGAGHIAPISPYKTGQPLFPLPPASTLGYHGSVVGGGYAGYPSQFVPGLDKSGLGVGGMGVPGKHPSSSPLTGASPPSFMQSLCRDPYCLSYPGVAHLGGGGSCSSCVHDPSSSGLKSGFPLVYPSHPLHSLHQSSLSSSVSSSLSHPLYAYGFMLPSDPPPHACNWVSAGGPCDKRFSSSDELLAHLRTHTSLAAGMDGKLLSGPVSSSSAGPGPASCHLHLPPQSSPGSLPGSLPLRAPPGLAGLARYHPYGKVHLPSGPSSISLHSLPTTGPYYPHYALYSQRLGSASALGYQ